MSTEASVAEKKKGNPPSGSPRSTAFLQKHRANRKPSADFRLNR